MFPSVYIFGNDIFLYDILVNIGTAAGAALLLLVLALRKMLDKKAFALFAVSIILSLPFSAMLRRIMEAESAEEFFCGNGSHFMGMVFAFYFIFPIVHRIIYKSYPNEEIKAVSAVYFCVQHFFSRLGCFSLGCCFGKPYNGLFAITFPYGSNPYMNYGGEIPIFPTQLFESFSMIVLLLVVGFIFYKKRNYGYFAFITGFSTVIFISEFFMYRYDYERTFIGLSVPQICGLLLVGVEGIKLLCRCKNIFAHWCGKENNSQKI